MPDFLLSLFGTLGFMPEGNCFLRGGGPACLYVVSDIMIVAVYCAIAWTLLLLSRHQIRRAVCSGIFRVSALVIFLGSTPYWLGIWNYWHPGTQFTGTVKVLTGVAALTAMALVWWLFFRVVYPPAKRFPDDVDQELTDLMEKHKQTEDELRKLSLAVEHSSSMVLIINTEGRVEYCNPAFCKVTGYGEQEILGRRASILKCRETNDAVSKELWSTLSRGESWEGELLERKKNGELFWCLKYFAPIFDEQGNVTHFVSVSHDITELKKSEETIRRLAFYDPLTKLPNRTLFRELLEQAQRYAMRDGTAFAVIYLDLDRFKNINDSLGHSAGDQLLVAVGQRLRQCLRRGDTVARLSGDEFAIILPGLQHPKMAGAAAATIQEAMNQPFEVAGHSLFVTASLGISLYPTDHSDIDQLLKMADAAMYNSKEFGRNQFQYYSELPHALSGEHLSLQTDLRLAVERGELEVYYQPKFEVDSEQCFTVEALLRWRHPVRGMVSPGLFIPIAEETGLIGSIGEWVLRTVCVQINKWKIQGVDLSVAVNLSAQQFRQKNLLDRIDAVLQETNVDRARLEFEITESAVMNSPERTAEILRSLKARGLTLSIDDFGTGYSSLSYLRMFPVDILKIDQSFVRGIGTPEGDTRIVKAIVALAHSLDLTVVAEGVETRAQLDFLKKLNCDLVQGYFYSPPLPVGELLYRLDSLKSRPPAAAPAA
jgi:diguanylate cyclase (GGDEF)-like protein/PAS domain S-box-containing protein